MAAAQYTHGEHKRPRRTRIRVYFVRITHVKRCWPHAALKEGNAVINQAIKVKYRQTSKNSKSNDGWLFIIGCPGCSVHRRNVLIYALCGGMWPWWWWGGCSGGGTRVCARVFRSGEKLQLSYAPVQNHRTCKGRQLARWYV